MTRIESGASRLSKEPMNLAEQVEQMDDIIRPQTEQKGQRFDICAHAVCHENLIGGAGMDAHLSKPVDIAVLEKTVRKIMGR